MPTLPIPLFTRTYKNVDGSFLTDDAEEQFNGFVNEKEGVGLRPGEVLALNTGKRNDGLFTWPDKNYIVCVDETEVTLRTVSGTTLVTAFSAAIPFSTANPIVFANYGSYVFFADGGKIKYINTSGVVAEITDPDAPTAVTHIAFLDNYILAIQGSKLYWAVVNDPTNWSALNFAGIDANPDLLKGLYVVNRQILLPGTVSMEVWENDGTTPFSRIPGGILEYGCSASYSPIQRKNTLTWLTHERQIATYTGTDVEIISGPYDKDIESFTTVSDCIGNLIVKGGKSFLVFTFPTEERTLAYCPETEDWSDWGRWEDESMRWRPYDIRSSCKDITTGEVFIGKGLAQAIACSSADSRKDVIAGGSLYPFKFLRRTGPIDHGSSKKKRLESLRFRAKRGGAWSETDRNPSLMIRYQDDGESSWTAIDNIDLGRTGETGHHVERKRLGMFRSRRWEISCTDDVPVCLSNAEVDVTVMNR